MRSAFILAVCLALSACATTGSVGDKFCRNRAAVETSLRLAYVQAMAIDDPVKREAAIGAYNVGMAALAKCPAI